MRNWQETIAAIALVAVSAALLLGSAKTVASENYDASLLGNGKIQAIINLGPVSTHSDRPVSADAAGGGLQLYLNSPDLLHRKLQGNLLHHHQRGLEPTCVAVGLENRQGHRSLYAANSRQLTAIKEDGALTYKLDFSAGYPRFLAEYDARYELSRDAIFAAELARVPPQLRIQEQIFCPPDRAVVLRVFMVRNLSQEANTISIFSFLAPNKEFITRGKIIAQDALIIAGNGKTGPQGEQIGISGMEPPHSIFLAPFPKAVDMALGHTTGMDESAIESGEQGIHAAIGYRFVIPAGASKEVTFSYHFGNSADEIISDVRRLRQEGMAQIAVRAGRDWEANYNRISTGRKMYDRLFDACKGALRAAVSDREQKGRMNSGFYCYEGEWVRDSVLVAVAAVMSGQFEMARDILDYVTLNLTQPNGLCLEGFLRRDLGPELDMNGQLLYALWIYWVYSGDDSLIVKHWQRLQRIAEFPLNEPYWSAQANMAHTTREFWERCDKHDYHVGDAYEMVYQAWISLGLAKASEMATALGKNKKANEWEQYSSKIWDSVSNHPKFKMIEDGHLIKRKTLTGEVMHRLRNEKSYGNGDLEPDSVELYPIILGMIDPKSDLAAGTLEHVERLWNQDGLWNSGGYGRYNYQSEPKYDPPGAWPLVTMLVARAALECGDTKRAERALAWIIEEGGPTLTWYEHKRHFATKKGAPGWHARGIVAWPAYGEIPAFFVHHLLGFRPEADQLVIRPRLLPGMRTVAARLRYRDGWVNLKITRRDSGNRISVNSEGPSEVNEGAVTFPVFSGVRDIVLILD
jgi:hypothetical protein